LRQKRKVSGPGCPGGKNGSAHTTFKGEIMKQFFWGFLAASFLWIIALNIISLHYIQEFRTVEAEAYQEAYRLRQHNNLLKSENQNLDRLNHKLRRVG
jgi:hypothetical protein